MPGFVVQFGINSEMAEWKDKSFKDDPSLFQLTPGTIAFAKAGLDTNSTQVFINLRTNNQLADPSMNFTTFGRVTEGWEVVQGFRQVGDASMGLDQATLAGLIAYDRSTIGGVVDRLVQKGFVRRRTSTRDRRAREVHLTDQGLALFQDVLPLVEHMQDEMLEMLTGEERSAFLSLARKALGKAATDDAS